MEAMTLQEVVTAVRGTLLGTNIDPDTAVTSVVSDNRKATDGSLFAAFIGENTDGHRYVDAALTAGAVGALISADPGTYLPGKAYILVDDTIVAVGDLARAYRGRFDIPVIGITGSVGKTTTKDMIASVLAERYHVTKTQANYNNNIGLPRTMFTIDHETEIAVIEMGMNHLGEINYLTRIAQPTAATITNVGTAHIGNLGSRENIYKAKTEIFHGMAEGSFAVLNGDDDYLPNCVTDPALAGRYEFVYIGEGEHCDYRAIDIEDTLQDEVRYTAVTPQGTYKVTVPALGRHMIYPTLTAAALGAHYGLTNEEIAAGIAHYVPTGLRMERTSVGENNVIYNDTYNASAASMQAAITTLANTVGYRHVAVLGDMFELGAMTEQLHREVGRAAAAAGIEVLIAIGEASAAMADEARADGLAEVYHCADLEAAKGIICDVMQPDTAWLFKASHGMHLGDLVAFTTEQASKRR